MNAYKKLSAIACLLYVLGCGLKLTCQLQDYVDIGLYDESNYLRGGITFFKTVMEAENGPLYSLWYKFLHVFAPDPVRLYYVNYALLTIVPALLTFLLLLAYRVPLHLGLLLTVFFLCSNSNLPVWPKVSLSVVVVITIGTILLLFLHSRLSKFLLFSALSLICAYIRPEFYVAFLLLSFSSLLLLLHGIRQKSVAVGEIGFSLLLLLLTVALQGLLGNPMGNNRGLLAFGQHFAINYLSWNERNLSPWTDWQLILEESFGKSVESVFEALLANPLLFFKHVCYNIFRFAALWVKKAAGIIFPGALFFQSNNQPLVLWFKILILGGVLARPVGFVIRTYAQPGSPLRFDSLFAAFRTKVRITTGRFIENLSAKRWELVLLCLFLFPTFVSCFVIYPREHYQVMQLPLAFLLFSFAVAKRGTGPKPVKAWRVYYSVLFLTLIVLVPKPDVMIKNQGKFDDTNLNVIKFIRDLKISQKVNLLEAEGGYYIYLGENYHWVIVYSKDTNFNDFIKRENVNMIYVSPGMMQDSRYRDDAEWQAFLNDYQRHGFRKIPIPRSPYYLLVADTLLP